MASQIELGQAIVRELKRQGLRTDHDVIQVVITAVGDIIVKAVGQPPLTSPAVE